MSDAPAPTPEPKFTKEEFLKEGSHQLRGTIAQELNEDSDNFIEDNAKLLKHHGTYQQDDKDHRKDKNVDGTRKGKAYMFMVRTRVPGGKLTAQQLLAELDLCERYGNGTLRITSRQGLQLHGVVKDHLRDAIRGINHTMLTTLAACGDVERNVMCCPAPYAAHAIRREMQEMADRVAEHLKPRTTGYYEIWLKDDEGNGVNLAEFKPVDEPIYGARYLPRKFKTAFALPEDNCVELYSNDLGFLAIVEQNRIVGYNVVVGGSMGVTPSAHKTFPAVAKRMAFVPPEQVVGVAEAIVKVQRDFGNREDRKVARMKYLIANWGVPAFKAKVEEYFGRGLADPHPADVTDVDDHLGWHEQGDGKLFLGVNVECGRLKDEGDLRVKSAVRLLLEKYGMRCRLTPMQSLIFCDLEPSERSTIERILIDHGVKLADELLPLRRLAIACPAFPTCGLSITESERVMPELVSLIESELRKLGLEHERITTHMTGCPNGCARPYTPDIGFVGKTLGKYTIYVGGNLTGTRLAYIYKDLVPFDEIVPSLAPLLAHFKNERQNGESFGDFCVRQGKEAICALGERGRSNERMTPNASTGRPASPRQARTWEPLLEALRRDRAQIAQGGGPKAIERQHEKQRLTARERIARLIDPETSFFEFGRFSGWGMYGEWGPAPAASVICGVGTVSGRRFMLVVNDATVKAGSFFPMTVKKVLRAQRIALVNRLPLIYLVDSAGVMLPLQEDVFPDEDDFGRIFRNNAVLSALGVPQIAAIMGNCVAGGGYLPVLCDKLIMTEGSGLYLAGPALVESAIGQDVGHEELGGARMHAAISGTIDFREPDDEAGLARVRALAAILPADPRGTPFRRAVPLAPARSSEDIYQVVSPERQAAYEARDVLACLVDADSFQEYKAEYGRTVICGYARIGGFDVGLLINQHHPEKTRREGLQYGGVIYHDSADKMARFIMDCNQTWTPLVFLQDVSGFMVGRDSEQSGIIRAGAKVVNAISNSRVPKLTVILGGSYGAGNYAMCGKAFDPRFIFAWPIAEYAVMGSAAAASTLLDVNIAAMKRQGRAVDAAELEEIRRKVTEAYDACLDPRYSAARGWVDEIIEPAKTRDTLIEALEVATRHAEDEPFRTGVLQV